MSPVERNEGAGRRWVKRNGTAAVLVQFAPTGADTHGDPTDYNPTSVDTYAVVVEAGGAADRVVADGTGNERRVDAEIFIPDDVSLTMPEDDPTVRDLPQITVRGVRYLVAFRSHQARPGLHALDCEMMR